MARCPSSIMTQLCSVIERRPLKPTAVKHQPFSAGNYVIMLWRPRSQHLSCNEAAANLLIPAGERKKRSLELSLYQQKRMPFSFLLSLGRIGFSLTCRVQVFSRFASPIVLQESKRWAFGGVGRRRVGRGVEGQADNTGSTPTYRYCFLSSCIPHLWYGLCPVLGSFLLSPWTYFDLQNLWLQIDVVAVVESDSFVTPCTVARQAPLSLGFPRPEYWGSLPFPSPGDLPNPGMELESPALAGWFFTTEPNWGHISINAPIMMWDPFLSMQVLRAPCVYLECFWETRGVTSDAWRELVLVLTRDVSTNPPLHQPSPPPPLQGTLLERAPDASSSSPKDHDLEEPVPVTTSLT